MRLCKVLLLVIPLILIVGTAEAKILQNAPNIGALSIPQINTGDAPIIGKYMANPIWRNVDATWLNYVQPQGNNYPVDWSDISGWGKFVYSADSIYGLYYVQDDVIDTVTQIDWQLDGIEFYIDAANTHTTNVSVNQPGTTAYQFNMRPAQKIDSAEAAIGHGLKYSWILDTASINNGGPSGYFVEFSFPLDSIGLAGAAVGRKVSFQMQLDDNDLTIDGRIHTMNWHYSPANDDYQVTAGWGDAVLGDLITPSYEFLKTATPPVIDGKLSPIWLQANQVTMNFLQTAGIQSNCNPQDQDWRFYGLYDNNYIYGLFTVYDDVIDTTTQVDWQLDGVEFYCDANNTHTTGVTVNQAGSLAYQLNLRPAQKIDSAEAAIGKGLVYKWTYVSGDQNDTIFSTSRSGWQLSFKYNLDSLGFTAADIASGTKKFSFQLQTDDNDLTADLRVHTSNWWYSPSNDDYQVTAQWGNAILGGAALPSAVKPSPVVINKYSLDQNYPNPFNPSTKISFTLAKNENVKLTVYNILGEQVAVLVNGMRNAGSQTVSFDANKLASGVYFYKLEAGNTVLAKKMMLLK